MATKPMKSWDSITYCAWAVDSGRGPLGIYWWNSRGTFAAEQDGVRTALFRTRAEARERLNAVKESYPKAKAQRVSVVITPFE